MRSDNRRKPRAATQHSASPDARDAAAGSTERLQKVLAAAGVASRRQCEELIVAGRVEVDREVVTKLGTCVDATRQEIRVDGTPLRKPRRYYYAVNKPVGVVSTNSDPAGRTRVIDLVPGHQRLFTVGRLDRSSEGLILVTNDGNLANRLSHPRYEIPKTYLVRVAGSPDQETLAKLRKGVHLAEGVAKAASVRVKNRHGRSTELEIVLQEGRNREIRRVLARVGHKVQQLRRIAIGPIRLARLDTGEWRKLTREEVEQLQRFARRSRKTPSKKRTGPAGKRPANSGHAPRANKPSGSGTRRRSEPTGTVLDFASEDKPARSKRPKSASKQKPGKRRNRRR